MFFQEMLKYTNGEEGSHELQLALDAMMAVLKYVNDLMHHASITNFPVCLPGFFSVYPGSTDPLYCTKQIVSNQIQCQRIDQIFFSST